MATTQSVAGCANIPSAWKVVPLEDVAFFQEGPGLRKWQWTDSGMKVINVTNLLSDGQVDTDNTSRFISLDEFNQKYRHFAVDDRDIVVASSGNTYGKVGRISAKNLPVMMNTSVIRFHAADEARLDDDYLYSFLRSEIFKNQIESFVTGSAQPNFGPSHLKQMVMPLPPLPVQRRIAGILSAYDELMENSQRRIRLLEAMARTLYREWFVHFRFPGNQKVKMVRPPSRPGEASAKTDGDIPQGWEGRFGDLATIERDGLNPFEFPGEEFEHFSIPAFDNGRQPAIELGATILSGKYCIDDSTVLLSKLNPRIPRIWLPVPSGQRRAITSTEFLGLKPHPGVTREFIYTKCCSDEFAGQFGSLAIGTSTSHQRVKPENLLAMPSTVPDRKTIARFTKLVSPMLTVCQQLRSQTQNLRRTRDLLLPRLLSGQVELKTEAA